MFNMLVGLGTALVIQTARVYPKAYVLEFHVGIVVAFVFLLLSLMGTLLVVTWTRFRVPRFWGYCLMAATEQGMSNSYDGSFDGNGSPGAGVWLYYNLSLMATIDADCGYGDGIALRIQQLYFAITATIQDNFSACRSHDRERKVCDNADKTEEINRMLRMKCFLDILQHLIRDHDNLAVPFNSR
uniref:Hypothetical_protein n=1 Tax=Oryza brachyantha TaxID=4533 RepID=G2XM88_ORYBR|nr:hypothetical_protein [Oryza brachyantha]